MSTDQNKKENIPIINLEKLKVNFNDEQNDEKKNKYQLTAKYGLDQMSLIRKRLNVENWMYDTLKELCVSSVHSLIYLINN